MTLLSPDVFNVLQFSPDVFKVILFTPDVLSLYKKEHIDHLVNQMRFCLSVFNTYQNKVTKKTVVMKHLGFVLIVAWLNVINGKASGHVGPRDRPIIAKSDGTIAEVYRDSGNGSSWLQMLLMFAHGSPNSQSQPHTEDAPATTNGREVSSVCKDGFVQLESGKCYFFSIISKTWPDALAVCDGLGSTLAYPMNVLENTVLVNYIFTRFNGKEAWWMGGSDEAKFGEWVWAHNKARINYTDWEKGQPAAPSSGQHCLQYYGSLWRWHDNRCDYTFSFVCQQ